ncbi:SsrA-binding protein SmpB [Candidatus Babeliales bacterium]|nr:SsrA-binding protein SmpB [Candidatus Babeliales bacterium]MBP9843418.1 SsrA-binding protein SmpB [Candidatus Babeliales bacterium]
MNIIAKNKKAFFDYEIFSKIEAGIVLSGDEVKTLRAKHGSLIGAFAVVKDGELFLMNCNIPIYSHAFMKDDKEASTRSRKLLLHRKELNKLIGEVSQKGITLIPTLLYFNKKNLVKVEIGLARHRKAEGKKEMIKERDIARDTRRELKNLR